MVDIISKIKDYIKEKKITENELARMTGLPLRKIKRMLHEAKDLYINDFITISLALNYNLLLDICPELWVLDKDACSFFEKRIEHHREKITILKGFISKIEQDNTEL